MRRATTHNNKAGRLLSMTPGFHGE